MEERELSTFQGKDAYLLCMKNLCLFNPGGNHGRNGGHGKGHGGDLLVKSKRKLINEGDLVSDPCSGGEILEVGDVLLESVIGDPIGVFERFLGELGELEVCGSLGIEREKGRIEVFNKVFSVAATAVLASLLYHILEKGTPYPLLILLSASTIFRSSEL